MRGPAESGAHSHPPGRFIKGQALSAGDDAAAGAKKRWQSAGGVARKAQIISDLRANSQKVRSSKTLVAVQAAVLLPANPVTPEKKAVGASTEAAAEAAPAPDAQPREGGAKRRPPVIVPALNLGKRL